MTTQKMKELLSAKDMRRNFVSQLNNSNFPHQKLLRNLEK